MTNAIVVFCTCPSQEEAGSLARRLVERRLAACVTILAAARSYYRWQGAIESSEECLLLIKTSRGQFDVLRREIESAHSYQVPEVLALPVIAGSPNYLEWLAASLEDSGAGPEESAQ
ncbi:MAG: divalent-cation tolerance protein CutA [Bryobacteraceae bacterium]|jgi:periplasmic divalent cation tolerance protein